MRRGLSPLLLVLWPISCASANDGHVDNPEKCEAQWEIRLAPHRNVTSENEGWPEELVLDANQGGDFKMAQRYMEKFGWFAAATQDPNDLTLYFLPDTNPPSDARFGSRPAGKPSEGIKLACYAAWISGVPFARVIKRGKDGKDVLYSVTTDNMPVRDF